MTAKSKVFVLDSSALLVLFKKETGWETIHAILVDSTKDLCKVYIHAFNLGEVLYTTARYTKTITSSEILQSVLATGIQVIDPTTEHIYQAVELKKNGGISYADCFVLVSSKIVKGTILVRDEEFRQFAHEYDIKFI